MSFETEEQLQKEDYKLIGDEVWAKGKIIRARCDMCHIINDIGFNLIDKANKRITWACSVCKSDSHYIVNTNQITISKW